MGSLSAPQEAFLQLFTGLESELRGQSDLARVAAPHLVELAEQGVARRQVVRRRCAQRTAVADPVDPSRGVLRMVQTVEEVRPDFDLIPLFEGDRLRDIEVEVVNDWGAQSVPSTGGVRADLS